MYNLKNVKNIHGGVLLLIKLLVKSTPPCVFFKFFKLYKWYQIVQRIINSLRILWPWFTEWSVQIRSFFWTSSPVFGLNTEIYRVNLRIHPENEKIRTRKNIVFGHFSRSDCSSKVCVCMRFALKVFIRYPPTEKKWPTPPLYISLEKPFPGDNLKKCNRNVKPNKDICLIVQVVLIITCAKLNVTDA